VVYGMYYSYYYQQITNYFARKKAKPFF